MVRKRPHGLCAQPITGVATSKEKCAIGRGRGRNTAVNLMSSACVSSARLQAPCVSQAMRGLQLAERMALGLATCDGLGLEHTLCLDATMREATRV